jgi:hypothetical protein
VTSANSAAGSAIGYQYQGDYALYAFLRDSGPGRSITLELHDDVAWEKDGSPLEKLQIKHTVNAAGGLGDLSPAMWRTLKGWIDAGEASDPDGPALVIVSSGTATTGTAASLLRQSGDRNPAEATKQLRAAITASKTEDKAMLARFAAFKRLTAPAQAELISRITVVDAAPTIQNLHEEVKKLVHLNLPIDPARHDEFVESLWGWWRGRVVEMLSFRYFPDDNLRPLVNSSDLRAKLTQLNIAFTEHGLPEYEEFDVDYADKALVGLEQEVFVKQLGFVQAHDTLVRLAIVDYYRATHSEVRWLERDFLCSDDVQRYERRLREAWLVLYGTMQTRLGPSATEDERVAVGQELLAAVITGTPRHIRKMVDQDFYFRGKHHMMAQGPEPSVGWHPDFEAKVKALLAEATASA